MSEICCETKYKLEEIPAAEIELIKQLKKRSLKAILVINKIDLLEKKEDLLSLILKYNSEFSKEMSRSVMEYLKQYIK